MIGTDNMEDELQRLRDENKELKARILSLYTNTNHGITMQDRHFTHNGAWVYDENFDYDAAFQITGDFAEGDKEKYAQMICSVLNSWKEPTV